MRGIEEIVKLNRDASSPTAQLPELSDGNVYTVIWQLFQKDGEHIRAYCTEVTLPVSMAPSPAYVLDHAICAEGFPAMHVRDHADIDFILVGGNIVLHDPWSNCIAVDAEA
jgi:hypothetical protein